MRFYPNRTQALVKWNGRLDAVPGQGPSSVEDRRQKHLCGLIVETNAHERHWLDYAQPVFQTPAKQLPVAGGQEEAGTQERWCRPDESFHIFVRLAHSMAKERDRYSIASNTAPMLETVLCLSVSSSSLLRS